jgi:large subunit ribosomal protein L28
MAGNRVSHSHRKTNMWQAPNVHDKRIYVPELDRWVRLRLSTRAMRTITKKGLMRFLRDEGLKLKDVAR